MFNFWTVGAAFILYFGGAMALQKFGIIPSLGTKGAAILILVFFFGVLAIAKMTGNL